MSEFVGETVDIKRWLSDHTYNKVIENTVNYIALEKH